MSRNTFNSCLWIRRDIYPVVHWMMSVTLRKLFFPPWHLLTDFVVWPRSWLGRLTLHASGTGIHMCLDTLYSQSHCLQSEATPTPLLPGPSYVPNYRASLSLGNFFTYSRPIIPFHLTMSIPFQLNPLVTSITILRLFPKTKPFKTSFKYRNLIRVQHRIG